MGALVSRIHKRNPYILWHGGEEFRVQYGPVTITSGEFEGTSNRRGPVCSPVASLLAWEAVVRIKEIPPYVLPAPSVIVLTLIKDWAVLSQSLATTLITTLEGFAAASIGGIALALLFNQSKWVEYSLFPYAVVLQVTPVIAIAPLLLIYLEQQTTTAVCCSR